MIRMQVQLTEEQAKKLRRAARALGVSVSSLVREAVERLEPDAQALERRRRALAAVGKARSGVGDLAERHDEHLADVWGR